MEIGGIKINLPKLGGNKPTQKQEKYADLNEPIQDTFQKRSDEDIQKAMSEFSRLNNGEGKSYNFAETCQFKYLYKNGAIDVDVVKHFKDGSDFDFYNMAPIYQMKNERGEGPEFYNRVFKAIDSIPNGREATRFIQNKFEPLKEFTIGFEPENLSNLDETINAQTPLGKYYKFAADNGELLEETVSEKSGHFPVQVKTHTKDYKNNKEIEKVQNYDSKTKFLITSKQVVTTKDKDGKMVKQEIMTPSEIKGMYDVEVVYANGRKEQLAKATVDKKTGIKSIKKDMKSEDGTRTQFLYEDDPKGNRILDYKITDENGKLLMYRSQSFEVVDDNHFISAQNGYKYDITVDDKKITVKDLHHETEAEINFNKKFKGKKEEVINLLKKVPGEELFEVVDSVKKLKGKGKDEVLTSAYSPLTRNINIGDDLMVFLHELGHAKDFQVKNGRKYLQGKANALYSDNKDIQKVYLKERDKFNATHSDPERQHIDYFTQAKGHYGGKWGGLAEVVAETNALTNTYADEQVEALGTRQQYLQQHFPKTIAMIKDHMNWKDDLTAIEFYGT